MRDPVWVKNQGPDPGYGSGMNNPDHISESLTNIFWVKILKFFDVDPGSGIPDPLRQTVPLSSLKNGFYSLLL